MARIAQDSAMELWAKTISIVCPTQQVSPSSGGVRWECMEQGRTHSIAGK